MHLDPLFSPPDLIPCCLPILIWRKKIQKKILSNEACVESHFFFFFSSFDNENLGTGRDFFCKFLDTRIPTEKQDLNEAVVLELKGLSFIITDLFLWECILHKAIPQSKGLINGGRKGSQAGLPAPQRDEQMGHRANPAFPGHSSALFPVSSPALGETTSQKPGSGTGQARLGPRCVPVKANNLGFQMNSNPLKLKCSQLREVHPWCSFSEVTWWKASNPDFHTGPALCVAAVGSSSPPRMLLIFTGTLFVSVHTPIQFWQPHRVDPFMIPKWGTEKLPLNWPKLVATKWWSWIQTHLLSVEFTTHFRPLSTGKVQSIWKQKRNKRSKSRGEGK